MSLLSSAKAAITGFRLLRKTTPATAPLWIGYTSCEVLPFYVFVDCIIDSKYDTLTISGKSTDQQLRALWLTLYSDYCKRSDNEEMYAFVQQIAMMEAMQAKISMCKRLVNELYKGPHEVFEQCLKDWGYKLKYTYNEQYKKELDRIVALLRGEDARIEKIAEGLEVKSKGKVTRSDFIDQLAGISKFMGFAVAMHDKTLTVAQYCGYLKMMKAHYEHVKRLESHGR